MIDSAHAGGQGLPEPGGRDERGRVNHTHYRMSLGAMMRDATRRAGGCESPFPLWAVAARGVD